MRGALLRAIVHLKSTTAPILVQSYVEGPHEIGVFYYRFPHETHGQIFAITEKLFPVVQGDGRSTVAELIWRNPRARFMGTSIPHLFAGYTPSPSPIQGA